MHRPVIATWMVRDLPGNESMYSQVGGNSSSSDFQAVYWRSIVVFYATSLRVNSTVRHIFYTDRTDSVMVDGIEVFTWLAEQGVEIQAVAFTYRTPKGFWNSWGNQFYVFDIIEHLPEDAPAVLVLDGDCVWLRPADDIFQQICERRLLPYTLAFPEDWVENGLMRKDMRTVYGEVWKEECGRIPYYNGGEFLACDSECLKFLRRHAREIFAENLKLFEKGMPYCREEAHMLSILYEKFGYEPFAANSYIRRIWTGPNYFDVDYRKDTSLTIWHLPNEKRLGIERLFYRITRFKRTINTLSEDRFVRYVGRLCGIPQRGHFRSIYERVLRRIERSLVRLAG